MERKVIDISVHNGDIDFKKVKSQVDGVIIRCGYGSDIKSQDDKKWKQNVEGCIDNDIPFGVYIYSYAKTNEMAISEAEHVIRLIKPYKDKLSYPIYYDLEEDGTQKGAVERARAFAKVLTDAGYKVGMYANQNWWDNYLVGLNEFTKWVAKYGINDGKPHTKPNIKGMDIWQYTSVGKVDGIKGNVDMNICYRDFGSVNTPQNNQNKKTIEEVALDVIKGIYGDGSTRKSKLTEEGYDYDKVQKKVNELLKASQCKSDEEIAEEVLKGLWEDGDKRKKKLVAAGYDYDKIQDIVNQKVSQRNKVYHTIQSGETLSGIANRYGTSISELQKLNGIKDVNTIYAGTTIRVK